MTDFQQFYSNYLDSHYPNDAPFVDNSYTRNRDFFTLQAYNAALGGKDDAWDPVAGYAANRDRIRKLYDYYRDLYNRKPAQYLWAGLGRMAGGAVVGGLDLLVSIPTSSDPSFVTSMMVLIGKQIFLDLAWQHELMSSKPDDAPPILTAHDQRFPSNSSYADAWSSIISGPADAVARGSQMLLANEQFTIIQPLYEAIRSDPRSKSEFSSTRAFTSNVHPYHRDFEESMPGGTDVTLADDRWTWITQPNGMWERWVAIPTDERARLVNLPFDDIIAQRWGPTLSEFLPVGGP